MRSDPESPRELRAVLLDAMGTLVRLAHPPWRLLGPALGMRGDEPELVAAFETEIAFYREHSHEGRDPASLEELRRRCAAVLSRALGTDVDAETMMATLRFEAYPDAAGALRELRAMGLSTACVSNWDCSLPRILGSVGLAGHLDAIVTSAELGAPKPAPEAFEEALRRVGAPAQGAIHVGDSPDEDGEGARRAGIAALIIDRDGQGDVASLSALPRALAPFARSDLLQG